MVAALLRIVVTAMLLGILGMHALTLMGLAVNGPVSAGARMVATDAMSGHDMATTPDEPSTPATSSGTPDSDRDDGQHQPSMGDMFMLCVAMLAAAAGMLLLLVLRRQRAPRPWAYVATAHLVVPRLVHARLGTGPPSVWKFSVIRC